jgi:hypothetical protein
MSNQDQPQLTAIIPTFRRPELLRRAMRSVLEQDYKAIRLCVYDNASGDETRQIVSGFAAADQRVRYHCHERNLGATANFEFGIRSVNTPFFSILSDDDYLLPGFYARALDDLARHPQAMFWAGVTFNIDEHNTICDARVMRWPREGLFEPPEGLTLIMGGKSPTFTGIVFRREVLESVGLLDQETLGPADLDFLVKITARHSFLLYKIPVAVFTVNSASFSATQPLSSFWPGWKKMFHNLEVIDGLPEKIKTQALALLQADGKRMLFRRGANALAQRRYEFSRDAAAALAVDCGESGKAAFLRSITWLCEKSSICQHIYTGAYRFVERRLMRSRVGLQEHYVQYIKPI